MKENVVVRIVKIEDADRQQAADWLSENLGNYKYTKSVALTSEVYKPKTKGQPKALSEFVKTVQIFKKSTGLKPGRIAFLRYWRNDNWTFYQVTTSNGIHQVVVFKDPIEALKFKLSVW
jgi:hypothetical protein